MKVLVVGGDETERTAIERSLHPDEDGRVSLAWASTIDECVSKLTNGHRPDVVLLDDRLTRKNPSRTLGQINGAASRLPVIVFSHQDAGSIELIRFGAADLIDADDLNTPRLAQTILRSAERAFREMNLLSQMSEFALARMAEGVVAVDSQDHILMWSAGMERIFGIRSRDALGKALAGVLPILRNDQKQIQEALAGVEGSGKVHGFFVQHRGEHVRLQFAYAPLRNGGEVIGVISFVREVPGKADDAAPDLFTQERLRMVSDEMPNLLWLSDTSGDRVLFNEKWLRFTGRTIEEERGRGWLESIHQQDVQRFWQTYSQAISTRQTYHVEYKLKRSDGQFRLMLETGKPQILADGTFLGMIGSCNDISETRLTQHKISSAAPAQSSFTSTLDHAPIAIWKLDSGLIITKANPAVAAQLKMTSEELVGKSFTKVVTNIPENIISAVLERGERVQLENYPVSVQNGEGERKVFWDLAAWPLIDSESNKIVGVCISTSEVTERQRRVQQREDFVATLVHDLKTPLIGADRTLEQMISGGLGSLDSGQTEVLSMLRRSNHQLLVMVQNLIEVYRYEAGQPSLSFEDLDIFELIRSCFRELHALAEHRGLELHDTLPNKPCAVTADRLALRRVFLNLLDNALKFTARGGSVSVGARDAGLMIELTVEDTGIGISKDDQSKLFQRFWQGESGKRYAPGTGLGLYLCRQIATAHKGSITVSSQENRGTTFSVTLPKSV